MKKIWIYHENGENRGPFSEEELQRFYAEGQIGPETYLWRRGLKDWVQYEVAQAFFVQTVVPGVESPPTRPPFATRTPAEEETPSEAQSRRSTTRPPMAASGCSFDASRRRGNTNSAFSQAYRRAMSELAQEGFEPSTYSEEEARGGLFSKAVQRFQRY